jgi:hypothetical protein
MADKKPEKALIKVLDGPDKDKKIEVMFNPTEYSFSVESRTGANGSKQQFNEAEIGDFTVPLLFDTYEKQTDVRKLTEEISGLLLPKKPGKSVGQPQTCLFVWGGFKYKGKITKVVQKFTMFLSSGIPVRATIEVTFKADMTPAEYSELNGKEQCRKLWVVKAGDRLDLIAYKALNDPSLWGLIARENNIENPLNFPDEKDFGRQLIIPDSHA